MDKYKYTYMYIMCIIYMYINVYTHMQKDMCMPLQQTATRCNTLQGVTTHHDASHDIDTQTCAGSAFQETCAYLYNKYHHTATHINARQRTSTHCTTDRDTHTCVEGAFI